MPAPGGHYFSFSSWCWDRIIKTPEGVVVGFQIFVWPLNKNNKNSGEKNIIWTPTPWSPRGQFLGFLRFFWKILEGGQLEF